MVQSKSKIWVFLFLLIFSSKAWAEEYTGQSPYRLIFLEKAPSGEDFDYSKDVLVTSKKEQLKEDFSKKILGSVAKGVLPLSGIMGGTLAVQDVDFLTSITSMASVFSSALNEVILDPAFRDLKAQEPFEGTVYLIPYQDESRNLFYSSEKISMSPENLTNVLGASRDSSKFEKTVTEQIKALQALRADTINPVFLLGLKSSILINDKKACGSDIDSCLKVTALLALKATGPEGIPFTQANDQVAFEKIVIPGTRENMATANMSLVIPLVKASGAEAGKGPWLEVEFGEFESFVDGSFKLKEARRQDMAPGMQGKAKLVAGATAPVTFSFSSLIFDLEKQEVEGLNVLTSLGYLSKRGRLPIGGFKVQSVNTQFQAEINKTIEGEIKALEDQAVAAAEDKLQYAPLLKEALSSIFGRLK